jgi:N-succinyldiaminopimelate aminotransferase
LLWHDKWLPTPHLEQTDNLGFVLSANPLVERMQAFGTTIFAEMSALAISTNSVNLGQGFPDTDGPPELLAAAARAIYDGHNQYPPGPGIPALRHAIATHQQRHYALDYSPDTEVLVTAGATEAIAASILALAGPGDDVVLFEPYYDSYAACIALAGARRRTVTLERDGDGWGFDPDALRQAVTRRTKAILVNTPHNPTGKVFSPRELAVIAQVAGEHDLTVISDEVYEHLTFDGRLHQPIATLPGMRERTVTISSAGKTFSVTGWKIGWVCAPPPLLAAVRTVKQFLTYVNGAPFQPAVAQALSAGAAYYGGIATQLQRQRDLLCDGLASLGYDVVSPQATYFATVDVHADAVEFCRELPRRAGVVAIPSSVFYDSSAGDSFVRFAFCKRPNVLDEALRRLKEAHP